MIPSIIEIFLCFKKKLEQDQTASIPAFGNCLSLSEGTPEPFGPSNRWWAHEKVGAM